MKLYVGNLPYSVEESDLQEMFGEFGTVVSTNIITDRETGRAKGFGFVEFENQEDGEAAIKELDDSDLQGRNIKVNEARPREERPRRKSW